MLTFAHRGWIKPECTVCVTAEYTNSEAFSMQAISTITKEMDLFPDRKVVSTSTRVAAVDERGRTPALPIESCAGDSYCHCNN